MNPSAGRAGTTPGAKSTTGYLSVRFLNILEESIEDLTPA